jgi:four helix bundle suffix protein
MADQTDYPRIIPPHGGYRGLQSYRMAKIVFGGTAAFCDWCIDRRSRTHEQMVQAARSGKQNIAEGSMASRTSKRTELRLIGIARAGLKELLIDFQDFLRQKSLSLWGKDHEQARKIRGVAQGKNRSYLNYKTYVEQSSPEIAANTLVCLIPQTNYLLDQQLRALDKEFLKEGGFTKRLYRVRSQARKKE